MLVIHLEGKHSSCLTKMLFGKPESRHVSYGFQRNKTPTHLRFRRNGRHRPSLSRRGLSLDDLANAARQHHQLVDRHDGHRAVDDVFEPRGLALAAAAGWAVACGVSRDGGAALSLFQRLARPRALARDELLRANV